MEGVLGWAAAVAARGAAAPRSGSAAGRTAGGFAAALAAARAVQAGAPEGEGASPGSVQIGHPAGNGAPPSAAAASSARARTGAGGRGMAFTPGWDVPAASGGEEARLRWASQELEALFLEQLWRGMRRTVMSAGMLDGPGVRLFEEMMDQERARIMAQAGALGLAEMVYAQMSQYIAAAPVGRTTAGGREDM